MFPISINCYRTLSRTCIVYEYSTWNLIAHLFPSLESAQLHEVRLLSSPESLYHRYWFARICPSRIKQVLLPQKHDTDIYISIHKPFLKIVQITAASPNLTQLGAELVLLLFDPVTQPPTWHTRKVVSSHNTVYYLSKTKC